VARDVAGRVGGVEDECRVRIIGRLAQVPGALSSLLAGR